MKSLRKELNGLLLVTVFVCGLVMFGATSPTPVGAWGWQSRILPMQVEYYGNTYSEWAVKWWQWALGTPAITTAIINSNIDCYVIDSLHGKDRRSQTQSGITIRDQKTGDSSQKARASQ